MDDISSGNWEDLNYIYWSQNLLEWLLIFDNITAVTYWKVFMSGLENALVMWDFDSHSW